MNACIFLVDYLLEENALMGCCLAEKKVPGVWGDRILVAGIC